LSPCSGLVTLTPGNASALLEEVAVRDHGDQATAGRFDTRVPTLVRLTVSGARATEDAPIAFSAQVVTLHRDGVVPGGTVAFRAGHRLLGTAPLDETGTAELHGIRLPAGVHPVVASYGGDPTHAQATSAPVPQAVVAAPSPVMVALSDPRRGPREVVLRAHLLDPVTGYLVDDAVGSVSFAVDGKIVGRAPLAAGEATLAVAQLGPGRVSARFHGDPDQAVSDQAVSDQAVSDQAVSDDAGPRAAAPYPPDTPGRG
jgi:hypothetical protein